MLTEDPEKSPWRHPHGMDVLKRLGIVERSNASLSEGDDDFDLMARQTRGGAFITADDLATANGSGQLANDENDDTDFIFDRASLLQQRHSSSDDDRSSSSRFTTSRRNRRTGSMTESRRLFICRGVLAALAYFIVGACYSIIGPTLGSLQFVTNADSLSSAASVISANAFGAIIGIVLCAGCGTLLQPFCIIALALPLCSITTLVVPWCRTMTSATMVFMLQGLSFGFIERAGLFAFHAYWRRKHSTLILFYLCLALGATVAPLMISPFFTLTPSGKNNNSAATDNSAHDFGGSNVSSFAHMRHRRLAAINSSLSVLCDGLSSSYENCTDGNSTSISSSSAATAPKEKKPPYNEATDLDHKKTETEKKEEALAKQEQAAKPPANQTSTTAPNTTTTSSSPVAPAPNPIAPALFAVESTSTTIATTSPTTTKTTTTTASTATSTSTTTSTTSTSSSSTSTATSATKVSSTEESQNWNSNDSAWAFNAGDSWEKMKMEFSKMNGFQLSYVTVASIAIVFTVLYAVLFCFTPCSASRRDAAADGGGGNGDYRLQLNGLCKTRIAFYAVVVASAFAFLLASWESVLSTLLTTYAVVVDLSHIRGTIMAASSCWFGASVARVVAACFYGRLVSSQNVPMAWFLGVALLSSGVVVVFGGYWSVVWLVAAVSGFCYGALYPLAYCWLDQQLSPSSWFGTAWCLAGQMGRLVTPACVSWSMVHHSAKDFLFATLVTVLLACIVYVMMRSTVREAAKLINVEQQQQQQRVTCKVRFNGGDALFEYHHFDNAAAADATDEITYFDRSRDATTATKLSNGNNGTTPRLFEMNHKPSDHRHY